MTLFTTIDISRYSPALDANHAIDESVQMPIEIHIAEHSAVAVYDGAEDVGYSTLDELLDAHTIDSDHLVSHLADEHGDDIARLVALNTVGTDDEAM